MMVLGLNLQWGFTGLFNVGVAGFVAIGAYTSALLTTPDDPSRIGGFGLPVAVGWLGAMAASGAGGAAWSAWRPCGCATTTWPSPPSASRSRCSSSR